MAIWQGFDVAGKALEDRVREEMERYQDGLQRHLLGLSLLNKKEVTVTKNEQSHFKQMIKVLDEFIEDAGVLHPTQYDRISGVRALLVEMAAEKVEEKQKLYHIVWEGPDLYFTGMVTEDDHPLWGRDKFQATQYTIGRANEYLGKLKNVEGMNLNLVLAEGEDEEEAEPRSGQCIGASNAVKAGDFVGDGVKAIKDEEDCLLVKIDPARKVVADVVTETKWVVKDLNDGKYYANGSPPWSTDINKAVIFESKEKITYDLRHYEIKSEYIEVIVKDGKVIPVPARPECGLKEIPKQEYYVIQRCGVFVGPDTVKNGSHALLIKDALKFSDVREAFTYVDAWASKLWDKGIWNGKPEVRRFTVTFSEDDKFYTKNEVLSDPIERPGEKPMKYRVKLKDGMYLHKDGTGPLGWSWSDLDGWGNEKHKPRLYAARKEAQDRLDAWRQQAGWNFVSDKSAACVEVVT
jgi:hypothetical protein